MNFSICRVPGSKPLHPLRDGYSVFVMEFWASPTREWDVVQGRVSDSQHGWPGKRKMWWGWEGKKLQNTDYRKYAKNKISLPPRGSHLYFNIYAFRAVQMPIEEGLERWVHGSSVCCTNVRPGVGISRTRVDVSRLGSHLRF